MTEPTKYELPAEIRNRVGAMLALLAREVRPCRRCGRTVYMVPTAKSGSLAPFTDDAVSHFADCEHALDFRKPQKPKQGALLDEDRDVDR